MIEALSGDFLKRTLTKITDNVGNDLSRAGTVMSKWVPGVALLGLVCLMVIPAPGVLGLIIGGICTAAIIISGLLLLLDRAANRIGHAWERRKSRNRSKARRAVHAGSGMVRKI
jgi:hypothetical protein